VGQQQQVGVVKGQRGIRPMKISAKDRALVAEALKPAIGFRPILARIGGSVHAGLFLSQALYWTEHPDREHPDPDGWFYETREQWERETCLTRHEQDGARKLLKARDLLQEKLKGAGKTGKPVVHYRVDMSVLTAAICAFAGKRQEGQLPKTGKSNCRKPATVVAEKRQPHLSKTGKPYKEEIPSKTPTEIPTKTPAAAKRAAGNSAVASVSVVRLSELLTEIAPTDHDAAARILANCRQVAPEITLDQIAYLAERMWDQSGERAKNIVGLWISSLYTKIDLWLDDYPSYRVEGFVSKPAESAVAS
jgi:hypothetical protein